MRHLILILLVVACLAGSGCTTLRQWWHNGLKVGPNYVPSDPPVSESWTHADNPRVHSECPPPCAWWSLFNDPVLDSLIETAYRQNLDIKRAACRVAEARAGRNKAAGNLLPQSQDAVGAYAHGQISKNLTQDAFPNLFSFWIDGFAGSWEMDLWGRFRRELESARADLDGASDNYNDVVVGVLADVATNYVRFRGFQQRLAYARRNIEAQKGALAIAQERFDSGKGTELDVQQARTNLAQTESTIPALITGAWEANNRLCVLLGEPVHDLLQCLGAMGIPVAPAEVIVGIPADLLRRRPDVRRAEREAAAQSARIGVAEADFYPSISVAGFLGVSSDKLNTLFSPGSLTAVILPNVSWKILNYGRLKSNVRIEDARLEQKVLAYHQLVLQAGEEVENAMVAFLQAKVQARSLFESVQASDRFASLVLDQYKEGRTDFSRVFTAEETLLRQQDRLASAYQDIAIHLIRIYRGLGGGWGMSQDPTPGMPGEVHVPAPAEGNEPSKPSKS
jgi:NodT family efflux transporter outer membrane factor (OMF) lipoprotein